MVLVSLGLSTELSKHKPSVLALQKYANEVVPSSFSGQPLVPSLHEHPFESALHDL